MKQPEGRPLTVLIVEDIDWIRSSMKRSAELYGYRVVVATDDREAFEVAGRELPDLILTEEKVPSFQTLMARRREHLALSNIPVVIVNPDAEEGARYFDAYLLAGYDQIASLLTSLRP